ncbi:beta-lactamase class A [Luteococcus japonicus]|uniref:Beta-lactamase class A n=1 Tax=Luteococcus japonicus TaxID=33984 RepID=A0A3N1ZX12_9ACTN|nr:FG-GAP-like repeat-containing protein [Luteococcus japonicus]ROR55393.1 beta-lactamase class A [Luteococcus japonicus]
MPSPSHPVRQITVLVTAGALGLAGGVAAPTQAAPDPATPRTTTVVCDQLGEVPLEVTGRLDGPGGVRVAGKGPVTVSNASAIRVVARSGAARRAAALEKRAVKTKGLRCEPVTVRTTAGQLGDGTKVAAAGMTAAQSVDATLQVDVTFDTDAVVRAAADNVVTAAAAANDPAGYGKVEAFPYASQLSSYTASRSGSVALAYRSMGSSTIYSHVKGSATNVTASIVKVAVMATVMDKAQREGRALSSWEKSQMVPMIRYSDNAATTRLWNHVGRGPAVGAVLGKMGLRQTTPGYAGYWGLTVTSAPDQVVLMDHFSRANPVINNTNRAYGLSLMRSVASDQDWGVTSGPGDDIAVKNGWLPRSDGWHVNSIGYSHKTPVPYSVAALTHSSSAGMSTQIATIEGASRIIWNKRATTQPAPDVRSPRRGDFTGDGRTDLIAIKQETLYLVQGLGEGRMAAPQPLGRGWGQTNWIGVVGDVTKDGRQDLVARRTDGSLHLWRGNGDGTLSYSRHLGTGWAGLTSVTAVGDFDANGTPDLLARRADGSLVRYALPATGNPVKAASLGTGWGGMSRIMGALGVNTDLKADVLALRGDGRLYAYTSAGATLNRGTQVAGNWSPSLMSGCGDTTGDGIEDVCYQSGTRLVTYPISRGGRPLAARLSGTSLAGFRLLG